MWHKEIYRVSCDWGPVIIYDNSNGILNICQLDLRWSLRIDGLELSGSRKFQCVPEECWAIYQRLGPIQLISKVTGLTYARSQPVRENVTYICNIFSYWLGRCSAIEKNGPRCCYWYICSILHCANQTIPYIEFKDSNVSWWLHFCANVVYCDIFNNTSHLLRATHNYIIREM